MQDLKRPVRTLLIGFAVVRFNSRCPQHGQTPWLPSVAHGNLVPIKAVWSGDYDTETKLHNRTKQHPLRQEGRAHPTED